MLEPGSLSRDQIYRVRVRSGLDPEWLRDYSIVAAEPEQGPNREPLTTVVFQVIDQAQMMGILNEIHSMGVSLVSLERLFPHRPARPGQVGG